MVEMLLVRGLRGDWASVDTLAVLTWEQWSSGAPTLALADTHVQLSSNNPTTADTMQCSLRTRTIYSAPLLHPLSF